MITVIDTIRLATHLPPTLSYPLVLPIPFIQGQLLGLLTDKCWNRLENIQNGPLH